jgi:hypothetical protein
MQDLWMGDGRFLSPTPLNSVIMTTAVSQIIPCPPGFSGHVYKVAQGVEISLRIWPASETKTDEPAPWLLWVHGGGMSHLSHAFPIHNLAKILTQQAFKQETITSPMPGFTKPSILEDTTSSPLDIDTCHK